MFILLISFMFGCAYSAPQGYNYPAQFFEQLLIAQAPHLAQVAEQAQTVLAVEQPHSSGFLFPTAQHTAYTEPSIHQHHTEPSAPAPRESEYNKEFYFVSAAPEIDFHEDEEMETELSKLKKNIRVVFIKAPENNAALNAAAKLLRGVQSNQQTAIYVLSKQHSASELAQKLQQIQTPASQPEVVFVKYRTPQEADQAQRNIQAHYAELNGPSSFSYNNVAPVHNFVTRPPSPSETNALSQPGEYLPPSKRA